MGDMVKLKQYNCEPFISETEKIISCGVEN